MLNKFLRSFTSTSSIMLLLMIVYGMVIDTLHNLSIEGLTLLGFLIRLTCCGSLLAIGVFFNNKFRKKDEESKREKFDNPIS